MFEIPKGKESQKIDFMFYSELFHMKSFPDTGAQLTAVYVDRFYGQTVDGRLNTLRTGDRILSVNGNSLQKLNAEQTKALLQSRHSESMRLTVQRLHEVTEESEATDETLEMSTDFGTDSEEQSIEKLLTEAKQKMPYKKSAHTNVNGIECKPEIENLSTILSSLPPREKMNPYAHDVIVRWLLTNRICQQMRRRKTQIGDHLLKQYLEQKRAADLKTVDRRDPKGTADGSSETSRDSSESTDAETSFADLDDLSVKHGENGEYI
ncbi:unnamed protein product [Echinostoma caproni]|uniref:PDZ domain-containing protein n=1 Tax=Echinostoma caproni TaxID=27848 RepID=A0A183AEB4_9TREM|nr:unnamed protein product [Echinostoma caproni]